jgi:hypothetical protein
VGRDPAEDLADDVADERHVLANEGFDGARRVVVLTVDASREEKRHASLQGTVRLVSAGVFGPPQDHSRPCVGRSLVDRC